MIKKEIVRQFSQGYIKLDETQLAELVQKAANKAGVTPDKIVGPLKASDRPVSGRDGLYLRVSPKTGQLVWAHRSSNSWGMFATNPQRAQEKRNRRSKKQSIWFGYAK